MNRKLVLVCLLATTGCANLTTISRNTAIPNGGLAIHLDAQQRLVYSDKRGQICAEPTPDAIQSVASSMGASAAVPTEGSAALSSAIQASTAGVGLHTQSITLMRDALYRVCEAGYNGQLSRLDQVQLLERAQDLTLGVLAIEQLTGAVVARQVYVTGGANASASANVSNTQAMLDNAKKAEADKKQAYDDATAKLDTDNAKLTADQAVADPKPAETTAEIDTLTNTTIPADKTTQASAKDEWLRAQKTTKAIAENFSAALANSQAAATGNASFADVRSNGSTFDKDTAESVSVAVTDIVQSVINKGHLTDSCMNFFVSPPPTMDKNSRALVSDLCGKVIAADIASINSANEKLTNQEGAPANNPQTPVQTKKVQRSKELKGKLPHPIDLPPLQ